MIISKTMGPPIFPIPFDSLKAKINYSEDCPISFRVDSVEIFPINLSHPNVGMGYKFIEDGKKFVFLTDNELEYRHRGGRSFQEYVDFAEDADLLIENTQTGRTISRHNLRIIDRLFESTACLVGRTVAVSSPSKRKRIKSIVATLKAVVEG